jgi:ADP-ribose pyrophosphatase YjhB (NUDIX family)
LVNNEEAFKMNIKQIFSCYEYSKTDGYDGMKYCPACGRRFNYGSDGGTQRPVCGKCGYIMYKNPSPAVSVLILKNDRVLLGKRSGNSFAGGKWCLPCGYIEYNEDFMTAATREVLEETGLEVEIEAIVNVNSNFLSEKIHSVVIVLLAYIKGGTEKPGDDITELGWFCSGNLPEMAFEADVHIIERYFAGEATRLEVDGRFTRT